MITDKEKLDISWLHTFEDDFCQEILSWNTSEIAMECVVWKQRWERQQQFLTD